MIKTRTTSLWERTLAQALECGLSVALAIPKYDKPNALSLLLAVL